MEPRTKKDNSDVPQGSCPGGVLYVVSIYGFQISIEYRLRSSQPQRTISCDHLVVPNNIRAISLTFQQRVQRKLNIKNSPNFSWLQAKSIENAGNISEGRGMSSKENVHMSIQTKIQTASKCHNSITDRSNMSAA